ncbi:SrfA family protein [Phytobacter massiliensis]|uniref:SrfA family protein n=1 Tax=Phytobacter massiliensis TaxID=1485952 RepID=UPI00030E7BB4|nr:SrfA family protein [Phytobacter massiliensis]
MAKTLLRSGDLDDFQAVGGGGQAVFDSALQIREALRLRKQQALVDCLAIPQVNDEGDRVDWYSPIEGRSVSWKAAEEEARFRALRYLENTLDSAATLSRKCLQSPKTAQQLFGSLLEKALQFPGENHLFLVDGKPVITFWGFVNLNESAREDVLACLRQQETPEPFMTIVPEPEPEPEVPAPAPVAFSQADEPLLTAAPPVVAEPPKTEPAVVAPPEPAPAQETAPVKRRRYGLWALPVAAAVAAAVAAPLVLNQHSESPAPVVASERPAAPAAQPAPALAVSLPLDQAEVVAPAAKTPQPEAEKAPLVIAAIPKDALVMDSQQVRAGSTRFLNGNWRVVMDVKDRSTGKDVTMRFQIQNNKGTARIVQGHNLSCRAELFSGLHDTGVMMIKSRGTARCNDGSRYPMPEISCKGGTNDVAECSARFDDNDTPVAVTFRKTGA